MTRALQLSGRRHILVTPVAAVSLLRFSTCAFVCLRGSCFCLDPGFFVTYFHAPISKACRDTLPSDHRFCSSTWSNFRTNRIETTTNSRDISAQMATRSKSLTLLPVAPVRWTSWARISSLRSQANISPSLSSMHLGTPAATYCLATHTITYSSCSLHPYRTGKLYFSAGKENYSYNKKNIMKKTTLIRFTASPGVIWGIEEKSPVDFSCCFSVARYCS